MSRSGKMVNRRSFLGNMLALGPALSISAFAPLSARGTSPAHGYLPKYFTKEEWAFLNAACGRLIPRDENGPSAAELGVPEFIDREMEGAFGHAANW